MNHELYVVKSIDCPEFITHIYASPELKKFMSISTGGILYKYPVKDKYFYVWDSENIKIVTNLIDYNYAFDKISGFTITYGKTVDEDIKFCELGPEILDLEISVNGCPQVGGHNCKFCYKNNTNAEPTNMTIETFKHIIDSFPKNLSQIAFGITGTQTNPDFIKMLQYCRQSGIVPNYTLSGADLTDNIIIETSKYCGAIAVSCYEGNKDLCYNTIDRFHKLAPNVHVNMHIVLSKDTMNHVMDVLNDIKKVKEIDDSITINNVKLTRKIKVPEDDRVRYLRHVVFLRIKPVGRAAKLDSKVSLDMFEKVINYCNENNISYGFDSCSAKDVERVLSKNGNGELSKYCLSCESSMASAYINVKSEYWHCSFSERDPRINMIKVTDYDNAIDWWTSDSMNEMREKLCFHNNGDCPMFDLSVK